MGVDQNDDYQALAVCTVVLFIKMFAVGTFTGLGRNAEGRPAAPEDLDLPGHRKEPGTHYGTSLSPEPGLSRVDRGQAMHRNDLENIPIFLIIAILLATTGQMAKKHNSVIAHIVIYAVFTFARIGHSVSYGLSLQPWRSIFFFLGVLATFAASIHLLVQVFSI